MEELEKEKRAVAKTIDADAAARRKDADEGEGKPCHFSNGFVRHDRSDVNQRTDVPSPRCRRWFVAVDDNPRYILRADPSTCTCSTFLAKTSAQIRPRLAPGAFRVDTSESNALVDVFLPLAVASRVSLRRLIAVSQPSRQRRLWSKRSLPYWSSRGTPSWKLSTKEASCNWYLVDSSIFARWRGKLALLSAATNGRVFCLWTRFFVREDKYIRVRLRSLVALHTASPGLRSKSFCLQGVFSANQVTPPLV